MRIGACTAALSLFGILFLSMFAFSGTAEGESTWSPPVRISSGVYGIADLYVGSTDEYVLTWQYSEGPVYLFRSPDSGASWDLASDVFGFSIWGAWPGMCAYNDSTNDVIIVVAAELVAKSTDSGNSFVELSPIPSFPDGGWWTSMAVGTNASWYGGVPDDDIYVWGTHYIVSTGTYRVGFTKSTDGGANWSTPINVCALDSYYPAVVSDESRIYMTYGMYGVLSNNQFDVHLRVSDDWGATWSSDMMLIDAVETEFYLGWQLQLFGPSQAIMTMMHRFSNSPSDIISTDVEYGLLDLVALDYTKIGNFSDPEAIIGYGVSGYLRNDGRFSIAFIDNNFDGTSNLIYATSWDSGLVQAVVPEFGMLMLPILGTAALAIAAIRLTRRR